MQNEKAIIVVLAYVIGFTTAFIGFGLNDGSHHKAYHAGHAHVQKNVSISSSLGSENVTTLIQDDGLYALIGGSKRVLSAQAIASQVPQSGYHHMVVAIEVSPNAEFIHYCSQETEDATTCLHFVYDLATALVYRVKHDGGVQMESPIGGVDAGWSADNKLIVAGHVSMTSLEPWRMVDR